MHHKSEILLGWDWIRLVPRPLFGLLYQTQMVEDDCGQSVECEFAGENEVLGENVLQCHFVNHKFHMTWAGLEPGPPQWEASD
jgi:hypothetical protein